MNVDSAEYANIVLSFTRFYDQARRAGMAPLPAGHKRVVSEWIERAIAGYWTHGGYMNWDSGLGFERWHQSKKLGLTQQALIGIASAPLAQRRPQWQRWAKYMLDRSLEFYARTSDARRRDRRRAVLQRARRPAGRRAAPGSARRACWPTPPARSTPASAARRSTEPPALYAYDPDIGRLAVTTPAYNTAIVAVNQRAFPYGGLDLARLFDGRQEVAANIGGTPPASFGALVRDVNGRRVLASQVGRPTVDRARHAAAADQGAVRGGRARLERDGARVRRRRSPTCARPARVSSSAGSIRVSRTGSTPKCDPDALGHHRRGSRALSADILFPSTGRGRQASVTAVLKDGSRVTVGDRLIALARVRAARGQEPATAGYTVTPLARPAGAGGAHPAPGAAVLGAGRRARRWRCRSRATSGSRTSRSRRASRRTRPRLAVRDDPHLTVLLPQALEHLGGHAREVGIAASPGVEDVDVVQPAVAERGQDVVDAARPAVVP